MNVGVGNVVEKELIPLLHFPKEEVLFNNFDRYQRDKDLEQAIVLGNVYRSKVKIFFEDIEGLKEVLTTIWGITDKQIILKQNITLPIHRVVRVNY
ncbi:MAG: hypothetical protein H6582_11745 [Crocinitomicaceae bacterium]|nr:hypothetical protein [Crocinitomicaceae bacterium]